MTSSTAFVVLILILLAVLVRQQIRRRGSLSARPTSLAGSGAPDPDGRRRQHEWVAIAAHSQAPFVR